MNDSQISAQQASQTKQVTTTQWQAIHLHRIAVRRQLLQLSLTPTLPVAAFATANDADLYQGLNWDNSRPAIFKGVAKTIIENETIRMILEV